MDKELVELQVLAANTGRDQWRIVSDAAQVVANYLRCHPCVTSVRYPGLKSDPLFEEASHTLVGGFGPKVCYCARDEWHELICDGSDVKALIMDLEKELRHTVE